MFTDFPMFYPPIFLIAFVGIVTYTLASAAVSAVKKWWAEGGQIRKPPDKT